MGIFCSVAVISLLAAVPAADVPAANVHVRLLRGEEWKGELVAATAEKITVSVAGKEQSWPAPEVLSVDFPGASSEAEQPRVWIEWLDGTRLNVASVSLSGGKATIELLGGDKLADVPARAIRWIRLHKADDTLATSWKEILAANRSGDVLVLRKTATRQVEENGVAKSVTSTTLDELEGTVLQIGDSGVKFDFDGDKVDVKREKLEGIIFFQPVKRELPAANLRMKDIADCDWRLRTVDIKDNQLTGVTPAGVPVKLALSRIKSLDFSAGNVAMLAQLPMEASTASGALLPKSLSPAAVDWFEPIAGKRPGFVGKASDSGSSVVSLTGKSTATYRTPEGFRWFRCGLVLVGNGGSGSDVEVVILGDGRPLAKHQLLAASERKPLQIEVDLTGVRRLSLQTLPQSGQGLGVLVDFQQARFTK